MLPLSVEKNRLYQLISQYEHRDSEPSIKHFSQASVLKS
jgi:hypothetical protein